MASSILLDVGNGELEIIVFEVNGNKYCINVLKTKEIINLVGIRSTTSTNKSVLGITNVRDQVMTVVDLSYVLDKKATDITQRKMALVCEFNKQQVMFAVDNIIGIRRIKWSDITEPDSLLKSSLAVGNILTETGILLMLDFEKIVADISASENVYVKIKDKMEMREERGNKKIYIAEDSRTIGELLREVLSAAGYTQVKTFNNGKEVLEAIFKIKEEYGESFRQGVDLLITDIEMPILDGHTVTRQIKEDDVLRTLPVVIFSSLITDDLHHKGEKVGADKQISKPQVNELVSALDKLLFYKGLTNA
ncbi:chemotaxis protein CheV [Sporanaerobium hydrogeniformans]|uniref:Chemotaxis protein CheV n=1 Tax=Sporanaerobium hydrogeniformans TaxID=3072179 RepID=A0AC61DDU1_9FIRM|nr:chemotaxis protein [Sporanaerobium hydrogeniformans]PHV70973.1 chemotaxis protein CheV [Sporanaerobium hydrogeniformans]